MSIGYSEYYETAYPCKIRLFSGGVVLLSEDDVRQGVLQFWISETKYREFVDYLTSKHGFTKEQWWPSKTTVQASASEEVYLMKKLNDTWYLGVRIYKAEYLKGYLIEPIVTISPSYVKKLIESGYLEKKSEYDIYTKCWCHVFYEFLPFVKEFLHDRTYVYDIKHQDWVSEILQNYRIRIEKLSIAVVKSTRPAIIFGIVAGAILGIAAALILSSKFSKPEEKE